MFIVAAKFLNKGRRAGKRAPSIYLPVPACVPTPTPLHLHLHHSDYTAPPHSTALHSTPPVSPSPPLRSAPLHSFLDVQQHLPICDRVAPLASCTSMAAAGDAGGAPALLLLSYEGNSRRLGGSRPRGKEGNERQGRLAAHRPPIPDLRPSYHRHQRPFEATCTYLPRYMYGIVHR